MTFQDRARGEAMAVSTLLASTDADSDDVLVQRLQEMAGEPELAGAVISHLASALLVYLREAAELSGVSLEDDLQDMGRLNAEEDRS